MKVFSFLKCIPQLLTILIMLSVILLHTRSGIGATLAVKAITLRQKVFSAVILQLSGKLRALNLKLIELIFLTTGFHSFTMSCSLLSSIECPSRDNSFEPTLKPVSVVTALNLGIFSQLSFRQHRTVFFLLSNRPEMLPNSEIILSSS